MSTNTEASTTPENNNDDDELKIERVVRERGSDRPKEIIVSKRGIQCTVTPRQVVKIDDIDLPDVAQDDNIKSKSIDVKAKEPETVEQPQQAQKTEQANNNESTSQSVYEKVSTTCSNAYQSAKNWILSFF